MKIGIIMKGGYNIMEICRQKMWGDDIFEIHVPNVDNDAIKDYYTIKRKETPGIIRSNRGGWQNVVPYGDCKEIDDLVYKLEMCAQHIFYTVFKFDFEIRLSLCWLNASQKHASNIMHTHPNSVFSGVYYIDVETCYEQGVLRFVRRDISTEFIIDAIEDRTFDTLFTNQFKVLPKKSYAYLFAPWTMHEVEPNQLDNERLVLGFNFVKVNANMKNNIHMNSLIR